jgi:hypothetical protein
MAKTVRRIVTGHHADGRSTVLMDGPAPNVKQRQAGNASTLLWVTDGSPAGVSGHADGAAREIGVPPPPRGSIFRLAEFPPGFGTSLPGKEVLKDLAIASDVLPGHRHPDPGVHRTRTIDYVVVLEGEISLLLDDSELHLKAGDVVVQQATNHAWINRGSAVCRLGMVFIDAEEPEQVRNPR